MLQQQSKLLLVLDDILAKLDPKTRARVQSAQNVKVERQSTPSIGLNMALRGGLGYGRQVMVWGNKSAGKSSFCLQMIAIAQKEGKTCAWIDAEDSYDQEWAELLGVDSASLIHSTVKTINDMVDVSTKLMDAGVDIIVVDSISALLPAIYFEKDGNEMKDLQDTKQIGAEAKDMTHAVKMLNYANKNTLLVLISQQRNQFGSMHASHIPTGGMAVKFFSSTVIKLWSSEADANTSMFDEVGLISNATMEYIKDRIVMCADNKVFEFAASATAMPTALYTHPVTSHTYTSITASGPAIYIVSIMFIYRTIIKILYMLYMWAGFM